MYYFDALLPFVSVPLFVFMLGKSLHTLGARILLFCCFVPMVAVVGTLIFRHQPNGSFAGIIASRTGVVLLGGLTIVGVSSPVRYFWAFRALSAFIFLGVLIDAILTTSICGMSIWLVAAIFGVPCLWFSRNGRAWPSKLRFHVIMKDSTVPTFELWQQALGRAGFDLRLDWKAALRQHAGRLPVVFQGTATGFQFDVTPLSQLVTNAEMDRTTAKRLGDDHVSANFQHGTEQERLAALVAGAVLTKLTGGDLYVPEREDWSDGDDAVEAAQDVVQPLELYVLLRDEKVPTSEQWQNALNESGLGLARWESFDVRSHTGFLPVVIQGAAAGFAFALHPAEFVLGSDVFPRDDMPVEADGMSVLANFRFADGNQSLGARVAAAIFAKLANGFVYNPRTMIFSSGEDALEAMREDICEFRTS